MTRQRRALRFLAIVGVAAAIAAIAPPGRGREATAASAPATTIKVSGSWAPYRQVLSWQNALLGSSAPVDLQYTPHGSLLGRQDFAAKQTDAVFSALPFTDDELAKIDGGAGAVIDAPVQVASLAFIVRKPLQGLVSQQLLCDPDNPPEGVDPTTCIVNTPYTGPIRLPSEMLSGALLAYQGPVGLSIPITSWNSPPVLAALGVPSLTVPVLAGPSSVGRSDPDETNYFLQQYVKTVAPDVWQGKQESEPGVPWEPITERCPCAFAGGSRDGVNLQVQTLALANDPTTGGLNAFKAGLIAPAPASAFGDLEKVAPGAPVAVAEIQNHAGEWVAPTPDSITKAVAAGGTEANYALSHDVTGAYPLAWIDHLYVPAKGLTIAKTEALATVIRYLATAGQNAAAPVGEGKLPESLVQQSLAAADAVVKGNCTGTDAVIVKSSDPGPDAPNSPQMKTIGVMTHCQSTAAGGEGFNAGGYTPTDYSSTPTGYGSTTAAGTPTSVGLATGTPTSVGETTKTTEGVLIAKRLPLPLPTSSSVDRLATLALGAGLYLLLRKPARRLIQGSRA
jgi:ABC-type phosphate transport system substrate-binding protein